MPPKRAICGFGVDLDAVANWIDTTDGSAQNPTNVSRGVFGATVGVDRVLNLFEKYAITASWFVPAHTLESFPAQVTKVRDRGHEIGLHGYTHEHIFNLSVKQQHDVMVRSIDVLTQFCGKKPRGYTCPAWATSKELIPMLEEFGIIYDHSFMHHDLQPYFCPRSDHKWIETDLSKDADHWMKPMSKMKPSTIVEIPASWHIDDWPPMQPKPGAVGAQGFVSPAVVEDLWRTQFEYAYREYDTFIFPISIHPQVSGKPQVIMMHERLIEYINKHEGVEWMTFEEMAIEFKEGRIGGIQVEGGV